MTSVSLVQDHTTVTNSEKWLITIAIMLVTVIEVLDMTIVNVALPHMMGALGANTNQITWILTSYIVSSAIMMPLTGFLVTRFGRRRLLLVDIVGFLAASMLCGMSVSLTEIVVFRILQGLFGATLVPLSQYVLRDTFKPEEQGKAMAIWGLGIMVAPILGPTIGGYITESMNWRWIFYLNIPVCIIAFFMALRFIKETPRQKQFIDWVGMALMTMGIGCLQILLDKGNENNWFDNNYMILLAVISVVSLIMFIIRGLFYENNIINLAIFKDRNFTTSTVMLSVFGISLFGIMAIQPLMLENLMNYPASTTGLAMMPRGIASGVGMIVVSRLINRTDPRLLVIIGIVLSALGTYWMSSFNLETGMDLIVYTGIIQGFGMGLFFVPLSTLALSTLPTQYTAEGSGLFSFGRSLGSSIGVSILGTIVSRMSQSNWNIYGGNINASNPALYKWLNAHHLSINSPLAHQMLGQELYRQSSMLSFVDAYWITAISFIIMLPIVFLIKRPEKLSGMPDH